ncbi:Cytidine deaminase 1 [Linum perenne]
MAKQLGVTTVANLLPSLVKSAQSLARPPISNYHVGVVGLGSSGRIFFGANIEFPGLPLNNSIHAEQFLITNLDLNAEFEDLSTFLPHRFGPDNLLHKDVPLILERHDNKLSLISPNSNPSSVANGNLNGELKLEALEAANRSHAPYSMCPSGVALMDSEGKVYRGSYMESAAYNPSLGPVQAAIVAYIVGGGAGYERIVAAALVEKEGVAVRQEGTARLIMSTVAPKCEVKVFHCQ